VIPLLSLSAALACAAPAPAREPTGWWTGSIQFGPQAVVAEGWLETAQGAVQARLSFPALGLMNLDFVDQQDPEALSLSWAGDHGSVRLKGDLEDESWSGVWDWGPASGSFELRRTASTPPYDEVPVRIASGGVELAATVLIPSGEGPFPGIVWAHGSGGIGRRSLNYVREAYTLAGAGFASVIYDKRGVGDSSGNWLEASFEDLAVDASAARAVLAQQARVDASRVGVGGISQGSSWIAPYACSIDDGFAFIVAISATAVTPTEQHLWVVRRRLENAGHGQDIVEKALQLHRRIDEWHRGIETEGLEAELVEAADTAWFATALIPPPPLAPLSEWARSWMWFDALPIWRELELPVFCAWGARDDIVHAERSASMLRELLGPGSETHVFPGADHVLHLADVPPPAPVAPGFHDALVSWLRRTLR